jgi:GNAT superfamily N-acetyltransferase
MRHEFVFREARVSDSTELAALTTELGYPSTAADLQRRLPPLLGSPGHLILVAVDASDRAVAWLHVAVRRHLESDPYVEIEGIVVASSHRGAGLGARLIERAEDWAFAQGVRVVRVRSNVIRDRAHRFYARAGYSLVKTSHVFLKQLVQP